MEEQLYFVFPLKHEGMQIEAQLKMFKVLFLKVCESIFTKAKRKKKRRRRDFSVTSVGIFYVFLISSHINENILKSIRNNRMKRKAYFGTKQKFESF